MYSVVEEAKRFDGLQVSSKLMYQFVMQIFFLKGGSVFRIFHRLLHALQNLARNCFLSCVAKFCVNAGFLVESLAFGLHAEDSGKNKAVHVVG